jgi:16S rRNA (cytosine967-C5)-methyltransferase
VRRSSRPGLEVRAEALRILRRVAGGAHSDSLLAATPRLPDERDRALLREIVLGVLRRRATLDAALDRHASRPVAETDPVLRDCLRIAAYQLLYCERVPPSAAVNTAVQLVKARQGRPAASFANAVLRALARQGRAVLQGLGGTSGVETLSIAESHPTWMVERYVEALGFEPAARLLEAHNRAAPVSIRPVPSGTVAASGRDQPEGLMEALAADLEREGLGTSPSFWVPGALRVSGGSAVRTEAFREGRFYIQDEASMLIACLASPGRAGTVIDLCAAPGGKALAVVAGRVVACDRSAGRIRRLEQNARRLGGRHVVFVRADAATPPFREESAELVLLDAPCTGTGVIRRHPEIRWRLSPDDAGRMGRRQRELITAASRLVRPGGSLVYSVCSIEPVEGEDVVGEFLSANRGWRAADPKRFLPPAAEELVSPIGFLRTWPHRHDLDGHFAARLERTG